VTREWPADGPTSGPSAPTGWYLAITSSAAVTIVLATVLFPGLLGSPVPCRAFELAAALLAAALLWLLLGLSGEEGRLNAMGETMLPRWRRVDRAATFSRTDRALREGIGDLLRGGDVAGAVARLQRGTHRGNGLGEGRARRCYGVAVGMLEEAWAGEWVRHEAARWLARAREEFRKEMR
jgi:hypothetical protein